MERFLSSRIASIAPGYRADYRRLANRAADFFLKKDVREIRKLDLVNYQNELGASAVQAKTQKNYLDLFKTFLRWCRSDLEILDLVPSFPPVSVIPRSPKWVSQEDQTRILPEIPADDRPIIEFLMLHGCRPAEARALRARDVDLKSRTVTIASTFSGSEFREQRKGRGSRPVVLPIHTEALDFLAHRLSVCLPGAFVFINPRTNKPYSAWALCGVWRRLRVKAKIPAEVRLYDATRHSVATQLRQAGVPIADIKDQLGHTDIRTTMKYAHSDLGRLRANMEILSLKKIRPQTVPSEKTQENR
jgi:integrase